MIRKILIVCGIVALLSLAVLWYFRSILLENNVQLSDDAYHLYIPTGSDFDTVLDSIRDVLLDKDAFEQTASLMKYTENIKPGHYILESGMSNRALVSKLRSGNQDAINVTFNNVRSVDQVAGQISSYLEIDSISLVQLIYSEKFKDENGVDEATLLTVFIPNTYQFYWNATPDRILSKLSTEKAKFWDSNNRRSKLEELNMTKEEVYTLASIVEKESNLSSERPTVAGVYLNRLRQGIPLQADPTVVFAVGDFSLRRVLNRHLEVDSPYNTYKNTGLPPGPIYMPSINSIDAVLANEQHEFIFFCAKPGYNAGHLFARTNAQHAANARRYHEWLRSEGIK